MNGADDRPQPPPSAATRLREYALLVRLHRPIGILLLLWPTLWALWLAAGGLPDPVVLLVFVAGVTLMRSAGCAINDYADRHIDLHVSRTRDRPLTSGRITPSEALVVFAVLALAAFLLAVIFLNRLTVTLSLVAVALAASYPFMKRFHHLPQLHLGAAFGWAVPMAFTAQTGDFPPPLAWLLFLTTVLWTTVYDTMYAMADRPDDLKIGVKSSAILFGAADRLIVGILQAAVIAGLAAVGLLAGLGPLYYIAVVVVAALFIHQQYVIRDRDPKACFGAFLANNRVGATVFIGICADYALG